MEKFRILVVDDDWTYLEIIKKILKDKKSIKDKSFEILTCTSGSECMEALESNTFALVLLDCIMPELDGYQVCKNIVSLFPEMPVIMITALKDDTSLKMAFESGAVDYITKPIVQIELLMRVNNILKFKESEMESKKLNSKLLKNLDFASIVQRCMIPDWCHIENDIIFSLLYKPFDKVSGDLFDIVKINDRKYCVYIGDVSGHGIQAALLMSAFQSVIKMYITENHSNLKINLALNKLNSTMSDKFINVNYMTITMGVIDLDKNTFEYIVAGHPPIISYNFRTGIVTTIKDKGGLPVGMHQKTLYSEDDINTIHIDDDTIFLMFTDGIFETKNNDEYLGIGGLTDIIAQAGKTECLLSIHENIIDILEQSGFQLEDDTSLLSFQVHRNTNTFFYKLHPRLENVDSLIKSIAKDLIKHVKEEIVTKVEFVVAELINNIIVHGYKKNATIETIALRFSFEHDNLMINIWDHGFEWQPSKIQQSSITEDKTEDSLKLSGRGLNIVSVLSSGFSVKRYGNINKTTVYIPLK